MEFVTLDHLHERSIGRYGAEVFCKHRNLNFILSIFKSHIDTKWGCSQAHMGNFQLSIYKNRNGISIYRSIIKKIDFY